MKKWNPMYVFSYCMTGVGFAAIAVAIAMYINLGIKYGMLYTLVIMLAGTVLLELFASRSCIRLVR